MLPRLHQLLPCSSQRIISPTMPVTLQGSCHCRAVRYTVSSHTPVPYQLCCCSICRKVGGYMGSVNVMGDTDTLKVLQGKDKIKEYQAVMSRKADGSPDKIARSKRSFCGDCSSMLWLHDDEWAQWIYPFASPIDAPNPLPPIPQGEGAKLLAIMRGSCPAHVPLPEGAEAHDKYGPGEGIEAWHKKHGVWVN